MSETEQAQTTDVAEGASPTPEVQPQESAPAEASVTAAPPAPPAPDPRIEFIEHFISKLGEADRVAYIRQLSKGVFVSADLLDRLIEARGKWFSERSESNPGPEKIKRNLIGNGELFYLNEGKICTVGYFIDAICPGLQKHRVQYYRGSLQSVAQGINPRDPILTTIEGVHAELSNTGFKLEIEVRDHRVRVGEKELQQFFELVRNSRAVARAMKRDLHGLRDALPVLVHLLRRAREVKETATLMIPSRFRKDNRAIFLRAGSVNFVLDKDLALAWSYDLRGKNLHYFLTSEYSSLLRGAQRARIEGFDFDRNGRHILGRFTVQQIVYPLLPIAFKEFILLAPRSAVLGESFPSRYTIFDCLRLLAREVLQTHRVEAWNLERAQVAKAPAGARFLASKDWVFILNQRNAIESVMLRWKKKVVEPKVIEKVESGGTPGDDKAPPTV